MHLKKHLRTDLYLCLCAVLVWFLTDAAHIRAAAAEGLALCAGSVIPALFPFLVVSRMLISLGFGTWASPLLSGIMVPLFHLPGIAGSALLLGLVGGYPIGAQTAADLFRRGHLTREEAQRLLSFCNNSNPVFLISVLGVGVFGSVRNGVWLWLIHILSALLTGLLFRGSRVPLHRGATPSSPAAPVSFSSAFVSAVREAAGGMLTLCAFVVLFYVLVSPLKSLGGRTAAVLVGAVELFSLTPMLQNDAFSFLLAAGMSGWGGLSVMAQTAAALDGSGRVLAEKTLPAAGGETVLRLEPEDAVVRLTDGLCYVRMRFTDGRGVWKPLARGTIGVRAENAEVLAVGSACPYYEGSYLTPETDTYYGEALAVLRPLKKGTVRVFASSPFGSAEARVSVK